MSIISTRESIRNPKSEIQVRPGPARFRGRGGGAGVEKHDKKTTKKKEKYTRQ